MSKEIEELARQYAEDMCPAEYYIDAVNDEERKFDMSVCFGDAKSVLVWLFNKPLASRLTEAEKEHVMRKYDWAKIVHSQLKEDGFNKLNLDMAPCSIIIRTLNYIFGKEFFEEEKQL